jgi:hypothetical protein
MFGRRPTIWEKIEDKRGKEGYKVPFFIFFVSLV